MHVVEALLRIIAGDLEQRILGTARHIGKPALMNRLHAVRARLGDLRLCQAERVADARPGVAADQDGAAFIAGIERPHRDLGAFFEVANRRLRIRDMPSKMPDRALRLRRRRPVDLVEQDQHVIGRVERRIAAPFSFARAWELPGVEVDRRLRIDRVEVQMMKAGGAEHRDRSSPQNSRRHYAPDLGEINAAREPARRCCCTQKQASRLNFAGLCSDTSNIIPGPEKRSLGGGPMFG